jgi:DNA repair protein RadA/Sms
MSATREALPSVPLTDIAKGSVERLTTGSTEFDRVLGGGVVPGAVMLLGGEPGIGKSTLLLQTAATLSQHGTVLYVSGEESAEQIGLRGRRLGLDAKGLSLVASTDADAVIQTILDAGPSAVIIDSIQTMATDQYASGAGSVTQVREVATRLGAVAKSQRIPIVLVGHVTKEGEVAGPKLLEHLVDTVLYLEGERFHQQRLLRGAKNRFGPTDEVGVLEMEESGLTDVANPSAAFLGDAESERLGSAVTATLEGTRCLLAEVQALTVATSFGYPKRTASGFDLNKLHLLLAVLTRHAKVAVATHDVYVGVSGGFKLAEPGTELSVALAVASAIKGRPLKKGVVAVGECGLAGEIRPVAGIAKRIEEAKRAGFTEIIVPERGLPTKRPSGITVTGVKRIEQAIAAALEPEAKRG